VQDKHDEKKGKETVALVFGSANFNFRLQPIKENYHQYGTDVAASIAAKDVKFYATCITNIK
jgi:hypothetical protein